MDKAYENKYHEFESYNWWFLSRRNALLRLLEPYPKESRILDIGCAGGPLLLDLKNAGFTDIYGLDFSEDAIQVCKSRGLANVFVMDAHYPKFEENFFDIIIASDSLEHLENDNIAIENWKKILKSKGIMFIFVPAFMSLWSEHDVVNHHYRRYTKKELVQKVKNKKLKVLNSGYWNFAIFFPTFLYRLISRFLTKQKKAENQLEGFNGFFNKILIYYMKFENMIFSKIPFPIGVSVFLKSQKND